MKKFAFILLSLLVFAQVNGFTIQDINNKVNKDELDLDLINDKVNLDLKSQEYLKIDGNGRVEKGESKSLLNGGDNLDLNSIKDQDIENNTEQGESTGDLKGGEIPANYEEMNTEILKRNIQKKAISFEMKNYEESVNRVKNSVSRYYNGNVRSILQGGVPSSFGFGSSGIEINTTDNVGIEYEGTTNTTTCRDTCNCGKYYFSFGNCNTIPDNSYSTGSNFKCLRGYIKSGKKCILQRDTNLDAGDSPYDNIRYNGSNTSTDSNPYSVKLIEKNGIYSNTKVGKSNAYYKPTFNYEKPLLGNCFVNTVCPLPENSFIYTPPTYPIK